MVFRLPRGVTGRITGMGNTYWCFEHSQKISVSWRWRCNYLAGSEYLIKENHSGLPNYSGVSFGGLIVYYKLARVVNVICGSTTPRRRAPRGPVRFHPTGFHHRSARRFLLL